MKAQSLIAAALFSFSLTLCGAEKKQSHVYPNFGSIERLDPALDALLAPDAKIEKLAEGFIWAEGPVWVTKGEFLLFSDVPRNVVFRWKEGEKTSDFMFPSGYTGTKQRPGGDSDEPGSNGLTLDAQGRLVLCQHGNRQVARREHDGKVTSVAPYYNMRRFNSPNDLTYKKNGDLYFTDPPYGLVKKMDDPEKELNFQGVYRVDTKGKVDLLIRDLTRPNGIAFSPDEKRLYVAVSDPQKAQYMVYDVDDKGLPQNGRVFFDATSLQNKDNKGLPDGIKTDLKGNLWATGPGGVLIFSPDGKHLGTIRTGEATANCAWGNDGTVLYITADMYLCRVKTLSKGAIPGTK